MTEPVWSVEDRNDIGWMVEWRRRDVPRLVMRKFIPYSQQQWIPTILIEMQRVHDDRIGMTP